MQREALGPAPDPRRGAPRALGEQVAERALAARHDRARRRRSSRPRRRTGCSPSGRPSRRPRARALHGEGDGAARADDVDARGRRRTRAASRIASRSATPHSGPSANRPSYSSRTSRPSFVGNTCSQPIVQAAQCLRIAGPRRRGTPRPTRPPRPRSVPAVKLRVGRRREAVEDAARSRRCPSRGTSPSPGPSSGGEVLREREDRAPGRPAASRRRRAPRSALRRFAPSTAPRPPRPACRPSAERVANRTRRSPAGPDRQRAERRPEPRAQARLRLGGREAPRGRPRPRSARAVLDDDHDARPRRAPRQHERVDAAALQLDREAVARQRVADAVRERRLRDDGELGARGERGADEGRERERPAPPPAPADRRRAGLSRASSHVPEADPADEPPEDVVRERDRARRPRREVDAPATPW